jgi:hypothetical protein
MEGMNKNEKLNVNKEEYLNLVNDFNMLIGINVIKLGEQALPGKESEVAKFQQELRKPILNGMNYNEFVFQNGLSLAKPHVAKALLQKIYEFIQYIEPRLDFLKPDASWKNRFETVKQKYIQLVEKK